MAGKKLAYIKVYANQTDLIDFLTLCKKIEYLSSVGASREIPVHVDGDGSADFRFDFGNLPVKIDTAKFEKEINRSGGKVNPIYLGE